MPQTLNDAVREICLWMPETTEVPSRGSPDFRVRNKTFATYVVNHHGDGRVALWLRSPAGHQAYFSEADPQHFFVPPYVGPRGWLGMSLNTGLNWASVVAQVRDAYETVAPASLCQSLGATPTFEPPAEMPSATEIDPLLGKRPQEILAQVRDLISNWPEISEGTQFGKPVWRAGKKTFITVYHQKGHTWVSCWVGGELQLTLTEDKRYRVPAYTGHNGWISLDVENTFDPDEVQELLLGSYRHFALKRMLKALGAHSP